MKYRAEIDGLRALAVLPVILFHAGFELFSGGFVGVDVFFVISGYLITTLLIEDVENKHFSIVGFYEKRARRILPALFFVMIVCIPFAWMWMLPSQMQDFSQSLIAVGLFASNILFWRESDYFDAVAEEKPLLHTWSLAVEEQYYVLFPIFLMLAWRFGKNRVFWMIIVMAAISLTLSEWGWRKQPTANFYLAPTRAWELFAGSIAAFIVQKHGVQKNNLLALLGLAAIVFSIFVYDESTPFPSVYALVPVLGVVMLILYADKETFSARLLSVKPIVGIGLISYSAYLWHQPLFAFARIKLVEHPSTTLMGSLAVSSLLLAYVSWKHIEKPFRNKQLFSRRKIFIGSALGLCGCLFVGLLGHQKIIKSYSEIVMGDSLVSIDTSQYGGVGFDWIDLVMNPDTLIVGDSHAKQYIKAARDLNPKVSLIAESACLSLPNLINQYKNKNVTREKCIGLHGQYLNYLKENRSVKTLIISHRWEKDLFNLENNKLIGRASKSPEALEILENTLNEYLDKLNDLSLRIIIIGNVPSAYVASKHMKEGYVKCIYKYGRSLCPTAYNSALREGQWINTLLSDLASNYENVAFVDPADYLCGDGQCFIVRDNQLLYSDHAHLTALGARAILNEFAQ